MIPIYTPFECKYERTHAAIDSGWISSQGKYIKEAEAAISGYFGFDNFILTNNGTTATHCLFLALRHFHPEVTTIYVPNNVYVAVWNCVLMEYPASAMRVLPVTDDLCIPTTPEFLATLAPNSAIVIVHNVGRIVDVAAIKAARPDIILIEDMCEGLFGRYKCGAYIGAHKDVFCSSMSFFANKNVTCGEGGGFATQNGEVAAYIRRVINQGNTARRYIHDVHAYNYRPTNVQAALLLDQFEHADEICERKSAIFSRYTANLAGCPRISVPGSAAGAKSANWMFILQIAGCPGFDAVAEYCRVAGIDVRPFFHPIHAHAHLAAFEQKGDAVSERLARECVILPSYPGLTDDQVDYISSVICKFVDSLPS
jgi:perosamine synthetase